MHRTKQRKLVTELSTGQRRRLIAAQKKYFLGNETRTPTSVSATPADSWPSSSKQNIENISSLEQEIHSSDSNSFSKIQSDTHTAQIASSILSPSNVVYNNNPCVSVNDDETFTTSLRSCFIKHNISQ